MSRAGSRALLAAGVLFAAGLLLGVAVMQPSLVRAGWNKLLAGSSRGVDSGSSVDSRPGAAPPGEGWFRVRVGLPVEELERPAGRDPVEQAPVEQAPVELDPSVDGISAALPGEALPADVVPPAASQTSILVRRDTTLWSVAREHYGRTDAALIDALARYNRLLSPNHLELGQRLWLPSLEELLGSE